MSSKPPILTEACQPRTDVLEGRLEEDRFAASIGAVAHDTENTPAVYSDADEFFKKTYPTEGVMELLGSIGKAVLDNAGEDVEETYNNIIGLDTTFGGGKTHDLIAAYHLANDPTGIENLDEFLDFGLVDAYQSLNPDVNIAVIDGEQISGSSARSTDDPNHPPTKTIWGEIAFQLFGMDGYREFEEVDTNQNAPSGGDLRRLFQQTAKHNLILLDELALYLEDAAAIERGGSNLANQTTIFIFRLLGAISQVENATLVYSISESAYEERAAELREKIREAQDDVGEIFKRKHRLITPTGDQEVGSVIRRRLFEEVDDGAAEAFADAYFDYYRNFPRTLPSSVGSGDDADDIESPAFKEKLRREYPFHPELLSTLTDKVDSIPKFQKTRGALKLLAAAINQLWENPPERYNRHVIRVYDLTPASPIIRKEISELCELVDLEPAVRADVYNDDGDSFGQQEDDRWAGKNLPPYGSHVTITVLWNSLAAGERAVGVTYPELYLHVGHPDLQMDHYDTARDNLTYKNNIEYACHYLYDEDRVQFKGVPNVARMVQQEKGNVSVTQAETEIRRNVKNTVGATPFDSVIFPEHMSEIDDDPDSPKLCVIDFEVAEVGGNGASGSPDQPPDIIDGFYQEWATDYDGRAQKRTYKNYVLFLVPDQEEIGTAIDRARLWLAQKEVRDNDERYPDITDQQADKLKEDIDKSKNLMREKARTAYRHLYIPGEDGDLTHITITSVSGNGHGDFQTTVLDTLDDINRVVKGDDEGKAGPWVEQKLWQASRSRMSTEALKEQFAKKPGLPVLLSAKPLRKTVVKLVEDYEWAYWDGVQGRSYWEETNSEPSNWEHDPALADSPDVVTSITSNDVSIHEDHWVYVSMEKLLDEVDIDPPTATECRECGAELPSGSTSSICQDCQETVANCRDCGREIPGTSKSEEPIRCEDCLDGGRWEMDEGPSEASMILERIHHNAVGDDHAAIDRLIMEIHGGTKFTHLEYLRNRRALSGVDLAIEAEFIGRDEETGTEVNISFRGPADTFDRLGHSTLDRVEGSFDGADAVAVVSVQFDVPHVLQPEGSDDPDMLQELANEVEGTGLNVHVRAEGPTEVDSDELEVGQ